jgi:hypothetical protein
MRLQVWSNGGGMQSAAIAALIVSGQLEPPDVAVIADTGYERATTWTYLDAVIAPALRTVGVDMHRVQSQDYATVGLFSLKSHGLVLPVYTTQNGDIGKLPTFCSQEWKKRVVQRWIIETYAPRAVTNWLGFSLDEQERAVPETGKWQRRFPLLERAMTRDMCQHLVSQLGWPAPPRSSCWMCPNHRQAEWREIRDETPQDWQRAMAFEAMIQTHDPHAWLHASAAPLAHADLGDTQEVLFKHCENEACFT